MPLSVPLWPRRPLLPPSPKKFGVKHYDPEQKLNPSWLYSQNIAAMPPNAEVG
jgi:hypothetical protein